MAERISYVDDVPIPGIDWPESIQPELPFDRLLNQWSDEDLLSLLDDLHTDVNTHELQRVPGLDVKLEAYNKVWDLAIDRGLVSSYRE